MCTNATPNFELEKHVKSSFPEWLRRSSSSSTVSDTKHSAQTNLRRLSGHAKGDMIDAGDHEGNPEHPHSSRGFSFVKKHTVKSASSEHENQTEKPYYRRGSSLPSVPSTTSRKFSAISHVFHHHHHHDPHLHMTPRSFFIKARSASETSLHSDDRELSRKTSLEPLNFPDAIKNLYVFRSADSYFT